MAVKWEIQLFKTMEYKFDLQFFAESIEKRKLCSAFRYGHNDRQALINLWWVFVGNLEMRKFVFHTWKNTSDLPTVSYPEACLPSLNMQQIW